MAEIGNLGSLITFAVSSSKVLTFNKMKQTVKGRWATHSVVSAKPKSEFVGADLRGIVLNIKLDATHGVKPRNTLNEIEKAVENGTVMQLVIGGKKVGNHKWAITQASETWDTVFNKGELITASVSLTLQEYL